MDATIDTSPASAPRARRYFLYGLLWAAFLAGTIGLQNARFDDIVLNPLYIDDLFVPRQEYASPLAFGYDMVMADFLFLRSVQAFGGQFHIARENPNGVLNFFETMTALDPKFIGAYEFGSTVLTEGGQAQLSIDLNKKGWDNNPDQYRLPFLNAYTAYFSLHDLDLAMYWVQIALKAKDAPSWLGNWPMWINSKAGRYEAAIVPHIEKYLRLLDRNAQDVERDITLKKIQDYANEWNIAVLNEKVGEFMAKHDGRIPKDLEELAAAGDLESYRACDYAATMHLLTNEDALNELLARVRSQKKSAVHYVDLLDVILPACIKEQSGIPPSPLSEPGEIDAYFVLQNVSPANYAKAIEARELVTNFQNAKEMVAARLYLARKAVKAYFDQYGRYPKTLDAAFPDGIGPQDPITNRWDYNPETGDVLSPTFPDLLPPPETEGPLPPAEQP